MSKDKHFSDIDITGYNPSSMCSILPDAKRLLVKLIIDGLIFIRSNIHFFIFYDT